MKKTRRKNKKNSIKSLIKWELFFLLIFLFFFAVIFYNGGFTINHREFGKGFNITKSMPLDTKLKNVEVKNNFFNGTLIMSPWEDNITNVYPVIVVYAVNNCRDGSLIEKGGSLQYLYNINKGMNAESKIEIQFSNVVKGIIIEVHQNSTKEVIVGKTDCFVIE